MTLKKSLLVGLIALSSTSTAGEVSIPHTFSAGTPAKAAEVNANFSAIKNAVNDNAQRIEALENPFLGDSREWTVRRASDGSVVGVPYTPPPILYVSSKGYSFYFPTFPSTISTPYVYWSGPSCTGTAYYKTSLSMDHVLYHPHQIAPGWVVSQLTSLPTYANRNFQSYRNIASGAGCIELVGNDSDIWFVVTGGHTAAETGVPDDIWTATYQLVKPE